MKWISFLSIFILIIAFSFVLLSNSVHALSLNDIINSISSVFTGRPSSNSIQGSAINPGSSAVPVNKPIINSVQTIPANPTVGDTLNFNVTLANLGNVPIYDMVGAGASSLGVSYSPTGFFGVGGEVACPQNVELINLQPGQLGSVTLDCADSIATLIQSGTLTANLTLSWGYDPNNFNNSLSTLDTFIVNPTTVTTTTTIAQLNYCTGVTHLIKQPDSFFSFCIPSPVYPVEGVTCIPVSTCPIPSPSVIGTNVCKVPNCSNYCPYGFYTDANGVVVNLPGSTYPRNTSTICGCNGPPGYACPSWGCGNVTINTTPSCPQQTTITTTISKPSCPYDCCNNDDPNYQSKACPYPPCPVCINGNCSNCPANVCQNHQCSMSSLSYTVNFKQGWNLFSVPVKNVVAVLSTNCSPASPIYGYANGSYYQTTHTTGGNGYWVKMNSDCSETLTGTSVTINDFPSLSSGWNLIGAPSTSTTFANIIGNCSVVSGPWWYIPATNNYVLSSTLDPSKGYFVKISASCQLGAGLPPSPPS